MCQLLHGRRVYAIGQRSGLCEKSTLYGIFAAIMVDAPNRRSKLMIFVRFGICKLFGCGILPALQQSGDLLCGLFIGQDGSTWGARILSAGNAQPVTVKPYGIVNAV